MATLDAGNVGKKILLALGNFEVLARDRFQRVRSLCETQYAGSISFRAAIFEDFLEALAVPGIGKNLADRIADFRDLLDEVDLLPSRRRCWTSSIALADGTMSSRPTPHMCPAKDGAYNHARCRYFGMRRSQPWSTSTPPERRRSSGRKRR